jgi:hypothetical protein
MGLDHTSRRPRWAEDELRYVREHFPQEGPAAVGAALRRPERGVAECARRLGLAWGPTHWSVEDEAELARRYATAPMSALVRRFRRSRQAILGKAHRMGLSKDRTPAKPRHQTRRPRWTPEEDALVGSHYPYVRTALLAEQVGRAPYQVEWKAAQLGVSKRDRLSSEARELLLELRDQPGIEEYYVQTFRVSRASLRWILQTPN